MEEDRFEEEEKFRVLKKVFVIVISFILLLLFSSYFLLGNVFYVFEGRSVSDKIEDFIVEFDRGRVIFEAEVYENLRDIYLDNQRYEFKVCLLGEKVGDSYYISDLYGPKIFSQDFRSVNSEGCDENTIVSLHSHPYKRCIFSEQDIRNYEIRTNKESIIGLMCEINRFSFYFESS